MWSRLCTLHGRCLGFGAGFQLLLVLVPDVDVFPRPSQTPNTNTQTQTWALSQKPNLYFVLLMLLLRHSRLDCGPNSR